MKKLLAIFLTLLLSISVIGCAQPAATEEPAAEDAAATEAAVEVTEAPAVEKTVVKIGLLAPMSGGVATQGIMMTAGVQAAVEYWQQNGGFQNLKDVEIEIVTADTESSPDVGVAEFEKLVTVEKVIAVMGSYQSSVTSPCATLANKYHIPYVTINAVADTVLAENSNYVFRPHLGDSAEQYQHLDMMKALNAASPITKMAFIGSADDYGDSCLDMYTWIADEIGAEMAIAEQVQSGVADVSGFIQKVKNGDIDLVIATLQVNEAILFTKQMEEYQCNVPIFAKGGGFNDPTFIPSVGTAGEGILSSAQWLPDALNFTSELSRTWAARMNEITGIGLNETACNAWLATGIILSCMDDAMATDSESLAAAIDKMEMGPDHWANLFFEHPVIKFEDGAKRDGTPIYNQNWNAKLQYGQLQGDHYVLVYPFSLTGEIGNGNPIIWPPA